MFDALGRSSVGFTVSGFEGSSGPSTFSQEVLEAYTEQDYVDIGSRFSTQRVIEQLQVAVALGRAHVSELGELFPPVRLDELDKLGGQIRELSGAQTGGKFAKVAGSVPVVETIAEAKGFIRTIITAADNAFDEEPTIGDLFHQNGKIGTSVPKVQRRLESIITLAGTHKAALKPWGVTDATVEKGKKIVTALAAANASQEKAVKDLPAKTRELYALKGRAYLLMKKLSRTARSAFHNNPAMAAKFDLSVLNRKGHGQDDAGKPPEEPAAKG